MGCKKWLKQRTMKCNILKCPNRGVNHLYDPKSCLMGMYCDDCLPELKGYYAYAKVRRFPRSGSPEHQVQELTEELQKNGINAVHLKDNGVKIVIDEKHYPQKKNQIIHILEQFATPSS